MSEKIDVAKTAAKLAELAFLDEKIADRGPIKLLPRPSGESPNVPALQEAIKAIQHTLRVRRNYAKHKGHDLDNNGKPSGSTDTRPLGTLVMSAVGVIDDWKEIKPGQDRALPKAHVIVRVAFDTGEHLWFAPEDLELVP